MDRYPTTEIIGKTIKGVVIKYPKEYRTGYQSIFLVFTDDTALEICTAGPELRFGGDLWDGGMEHARRYVSDAFRVFYEAYQDDQGEIVEKLDW
ncbi:MAG: hypothetical protein JXB15_08440 [Anaerolineales bacterium]|nr:hypothetical protein [Anaerolineales bacterium]